MEMKQPSEPNPEDCCNSGCNPCIFDVYETQLKLYKKFLETGNCDQNTSMTGKTNFNLYGQNLISQLEYTTFVLIERIDLCDAHKLFKFKHIESVDSDSVWWRAGQNFLLKYIAKHASLTRAYTPVRVKTLSPCEKNEFQVIVKKYENGLVSNYLFSLSIGDKTLWRGPYGSFDYCSNKYSRIVMIAQGTGIAPLFSVIEEILYNEDDMAKVVLLFCCRDEKTILLRNELYSLQSYWNFSYQIYLSQPMFSNSKPLKYKEPIKNHKLDSAEMLHLLKSFNSGDQYLLCGSPEFMACFEKCLGSIGIDKDKIFLFT